MSTIIMKDTNWRKELDSKLEHDLNMLLKETKDYSYAIEKSKDKSKAQIWVALALINSKLNVLIQESSKKGPKLKKHELDSIVKTLEKL